MPERTCLGCRKTGNKAEFIRVVRLPDGDVKVDFTGKMNGRGAYLCRNPECLKRAVKTGAIRRSLNVEIPDEVMDRLRGEIES